MGTVILFAGDRLETLGYRLQPVARRAERPKDGTEAFRLLGVALDAP